MAKSKRVQHEMPRTKKYLKKTRSRLIEKKIAHEVAVTKQAYKKRAEKGKQEVHEQCLKGSINMNTFTTWDTNMFALMGLVAEFIRKFIWYKDEPWKGARIFWDKTKLWVKIAYKSKEIYDFQLAVNLNDGSTDPLKKGKVDISMKYMGEELPDDAKEEFKEHLYELIQARIHDQIAHANEIAAGDKVATHARQIIPENSRQIADLRRPANIPEQLPAEFGNPGPRAGGDYNIGNIRIMRVDRDGDFDPDAPTTSPPNIGALYFQNPADREEWRYLSPLEFQTLMSREDSHDLANRLSARSELDGMYIPKGITVST